MRLWSIHPSLLDRQGLVALWREALLAQAVLAGRTQGYTRHPQLIRFRQSTDPLGAIAAYLDAVYVEAVARGYKFDPNRIDHVERLESQINVTDGQLEYELEHLRNKLHARNPHLLSIVPQANPPIHPCFKKVEGEVEPWEVITA
ncbi:pyrimidine dimer DNA glycosylase/endonuclease V [Arcanobacterium ihumii]|uniref:pyrimidine dimer DNA glycosylase/endonuclease V n=1 Tax=Arcanobacterium ihumii TaxID=2138162 RepID=UPI000F532D2D|nr:pyrimidine dimer DNA glycosylase/endonuclease V [Arcanobacterium ihumii]